MCATGKGKWDRRRAPFKAQLGVVFVLGSIGHCFNARQAGDRVGIGVGRCQSPSCEVFAQNTDSSVQVGVCLDAQEAAA